MALIDPDDRVLGAIINDRSGTPIEEPEPDEEEIDFDELVERLREDIDEAEDFIDSTFMGERERAQRYYNGESEVEVEGNHSRYVATKVRDTIRGVRPSLLRVFLSSTSPVQFLAGNQVSAGLAQQQTTYVRQQFDAMGGYMAIYEAFQTAMLSKVGPVQFWWQDTSTYSKRSWENLTRDQIEFLQNNPDYRVTSVETRTVPMIGPDGVEPVEYFDIEADYLQKAGRPAMAAIPLHEFIISDEATNNPDLPPLVIGRQREMTVSEVLQTYPEVDPEDLDELSTEDIEMQRGGGESQARRGYIKASRSTDRTPDPSMRKVLITDVFYHADLDGTGIAQCWRWILGGIDKTLLHYERAEDGHNYALFQVDPEPGTVWGKSYYDLTHNDQDGITSLTRGVIDNLHMSNTPRIAYHETMVNGHDVANFDVGTPIRFRAPGMIQVIEVPFTGAGSIPLLEYWNADVENKTGMTRASLGLDPRALQSTDKEAVQNTIRNAAGQIEVTARNLAETGMKPLFRGILRLCLKHQDPRQVMWITSTRYVPVDLTAYDPTLTMRVNVGVGGSDDAQRVATLSEVMAIQEKILSQYGPVQPFVQPHHLSNTIHDYIQAGGIIDSSRYFGSVTPEESPALLQQLQEMQAAAGEKEPPEVAGMKAAEEIRANAKIQTDTNKALLEAKQTRLEAELKIAEATRQDDIERDKMLQDLFLAAAEIVGKYGTNINIAGIKAAQDANSVEAQERIAAQAATVQERRADRTDFSREMVGAATIASNEEIAARERDNRLRLAQLAARARPNGAA